MEQLTRRDVLSTGSVLLGSTVAGCVGARTTGTPSPTTTTTDFPWPENYRTFGSVTIGNRDAVAAPDENRPHSLQLWNDLDAERPVRIRITEGDATRFDETQTFPRNEVLEIELLEPGEYHVAIYVDEGVAGQFTVPRSQFDCNTSFTEIRLTPSGSIQRRTVATEIACYPRVNQTRFVIDDRACGADDEARVTFESDGVSVRGQLEVPTPCNGAALADAHVIPEEETLRIAIETTPPLPNETCVKCLGVIDYRATVMFQGSGVSTVAVYHDETEITRASQ